MSKEIKVGDTVVFKKNGSDFKYKVEHIIEDVMCVLSRKAMDGIDYSWESHNGVKYMCRPKTSLELYTEPPKFKIGDVLADRCGSDTSEHYSYGPDASVLSIVSEPIKALGTYFYVLRYNTDTHAPFIVIEKFVDKNYVKVK